MSESRHAVGDRENARRLLAERAPHLLPVFDAALAEGRKIEAARIVRRALDSGRGEGA